MTKQARAAFVLATMMAVCTGSAAAQFHAGVLPRGTVAVSVGGVSAHAPAAAPLHALLTPARVPELAALQSGLTDFFAATDTTGGTRFRLLPSDVALGGARSGYTADRAALVLGVAAGLTRRMTVYVRVPLEQYAAVPPRVAVGTALGLNPDTAANRALLASLGAGFAELGASPYLPVASTRVGTELAARVRNRTGGTLRLPTAPLGAELVQALLTGLGYEPEAGAAEPTVEALSLGDVEAGVRFEIINTAPGFPYPDSAGARGVRATLVLAATIPTAAETPPAVLLDAPWGTGGTVGRAQLLGEIFWSERWAAGFSAGAAVGTVREVRVQQELGGDGFADVLVERVIEREATSRIALEATPRYRLTRTISLGGWYLGALGLQAADGASVRQAQSLGAQAGFSTLPIRREGRVIPLEISLGMLRTVVGEPRGTVFVVEGRTVVRAWGRP